MTSSFGSPGGGYFGTSRGQRTYEPQQSEPWQFSDSFYRQVGDLLGIGAPSSTYQVRQIDEFASQYGVNKLDSPNDVLKIREAYQGSQSSGGDSGGGGGGGGSSGNTGNGYEDFKSQADALRAQVEQLQLQNQQTVDALREEFKATLAGQEDASRKALEQQQASLDALLLQERKQFEKQFSFQQEAQQRAQTLAQQQAQRAANLASAYIPAAAPGADTAGYGDAARGRGNRQASRLSQLNTLTGIGTASRTSGLVVA